MERRKSEEGLLFRAMVLDNLSEAIFLANLNGAFVYANLAACELFGYPCDEFLNLNLLTVLQIPEEEKKVLMENLQKTEQIDLHTVHVMKNQRESSNSFADGFSEDCSWKADNQRNSQSERTIEITVILNLKGAWKKILPY